MAYAMPREPREDVPSGGIRSHIEPEAAGSDPSAALTPAVKLVGYMGGAAKAVEEALGDAAISGNMLRFLTRVHARSFGDAHVQRQAGMAEPGLWCQFDLTRWAEMFGWQRQNMVKMRQQALTLGILTYEPDPENPGAGLLKWNLDFTQWLPLQDSYRRARYTRHGAGRKPKAHQVQASESNVLRTPTVDDSTVLRLPARDNQTYYGENSNVLRSTIKRITADRSEGWEQTRWAETLESERE
jgi:hypothetical protein